MLVLGGFLGWVLVGGPSRTAWTIRDGAVPWLPSMAGARFSNLDGILSCAPSFVKLDISLVQGLESDYHRAVEWVSAK